MAETVLIMRSRNLLALYFLKKKAKRKRSFWVRRVYEERDRKGEFALLVKQMQLSDQAYFKDRFRMSPQRFEELLRIVYPDLAKQTTKMRDPISAEQRLAVTLRFLATGDCQASIAASYRMSPTTVGRIISETCRSIWQRLIEKGFMHTPRTKEEWLTVAQEFEKRWNFPHCLGAIDGKHINMFAPPNSGSQFFNYKGFHSIVLMAVCDANYRFLMVEIGDSGRQSDGSVYNNSAIGNAIDTSVLNFPPDEPIKDTQRVLPYVFVCDEAFGLKRHMMKPYPFRSLTEAKRIFNYRLSRARRVIENSFGILANRFRVFLRPMKGDVAKVMEVTQACTSLHNYLLASNNSSDYADFQSVEELSSSPYFQSLDSGKNNNFTQSAKLIRDAFKDYFNNEGALSWQLDRVNRVA